MTKSIEEQASEYAEAWIKSHHIRLSFIAGAKARDAQWSAVVRELRDALKKIGCDCGYDTIDGYGDSTCIPCEYTSKADQILKEMGL